MSDPVNPNESEVKRVAFVTGGSRGIGLAAARQLAAAGHDVAVGSHENRTC